MGLSNILDFLTSLKDNNNREWFAENKLWYEECKNEFLEISRKLITEISIFDEEIRHVDVRNCVFRIYRDIRFSKDKTPYKTHFGIFVAAEGGRKSERAGYYFHIEPGRTFVGAGVWCPPPPLLKALRKSVYDNIEELNEIINEASFKGYYDNFFEEDKLKTVPVGFPKDSEAAELLKLKHYMVEHIWDGDIIHKDNFMEKVVESFQVAYPMNRFFNYAVDEFKGRI